MKETLETSKGRFIITDDLEKINRWINNGRYEYICQVRRCNEKESSSIVDEDNEYGVTLYQNYATTSMQYFDEQLSATESLHSLLKSQGIEITNNTYIFKVN